MNTLLIEKPLALTVALSLSSSVWGVTFEVTNAEEFHAAQSVLADNRGG